MLTPKELIAIAPVLVEVGRPLSMVLASAHGSGILKEADEKEYRSPDIDQFRAMSSGSLNQFFLGLRDVLYDERVSHLDVGGLGELRTHFQLLCESNDLRVLRNSAEELNRVFNSEFTTYFFRSLPEKLFGDWGCSFFKWICFEGLHHLTESEVGVFAEQIGNSYDRDHKDRADTSCYRLLIDKSNFTARLAGQPPCRLGNTSKFWLLDALWKNRNSFVEFIDLIDVLEGGEHCANSLASIKFRLVNDLKTAGYEQLAGLIRAEKKHYGLFLKWPPTDV